ncbi:FlgO family outer membrane protein [Pseudoalteromonas sp. G4]|uniref:FlgO family outer membrane protein n=1 Tax=Pseudoalteromonas sp. G4 TaxID=2992761 RepID=UPI00237E3534|nr:FlgO family outer membrane protein [Pseudoalteromonas sp. G4]MDE3271771.1 FlgO family outer membrane protein [Pseudoalteromonas sp. G4]
MKLSIIVSAILLTGCASKTQQQSIEPVISEAETYHPSYRVYPINDYLLDEYVEQLAIKLMENLAAEPETIRLAVASFVDLDGSLQTASRLGNQLAESMITEVQAFGLNLGNQLAESMITEVQAFGLNIVDHKVMPMVRIDSGGDYSYSRDVMQLNTKGHINAVLSGTLLYKENGVVINSRITSLENQSILASAKYIIPYSVAFDN